MSSVQGWFRQLKIRQRLLLAFGLLVIINFIPFAAFTLIDAPANNALSRLEAVRRENDQVKLVQEEIQIIRARTNRGGIEFLIGRPETAYDFYTEALMHVDDAVALMDQIQAQTDPPVSEDANILLNDVRSHLISYGEASNEILSEIVPARLDSTSGLGLARDLLVPLEAINEHMPIYDVLRTAYQYVGSFNRDAIIQLPILVYGLGQRIEQADVPDAEKVEMRASLTEAQTLLSQLFAIDIQVSTLFNQMGLDVDNSINILSTHITAQDERQSDLQMVYEHALEIRRAVSPMIILAILIISIILPLVLSRTLTNPIYELQEATQTIASGDYGKRMQVAREDEIGQLAHSFNQMADAVEERDRTLTAQSDALNNALIKAEEVSRLKSEFLATMSHELRTPLNAILGYSGLLEMGGMGELDEKVYKAVTTIQKSGDHLLAMINDILDLAKIESGQITLTQFPNEVKTQVEAWKQRIALLAEAKGLDFETRVDPALPEEIVADWDRLTQIVMNLLSNAVKFTKQGHVKLEVCRASDEDWTIRVSDTGIGMNPESLEYIFDEFRQVDGSHQRSYEGTGLGLAIVRKLSQKMSGEISVESAPNSGSTFTVKLPLVTEIDSAAD